MRMTPKATTSDNGYYVSLAFVDSLEIMHDINFKPTQEHRPQ